MKKKNHIKMRFSTLLLCCLAILLYAAPCYGDFLNMRFTGEGVYCNELYCEEYNNKDGEYNITEQLIDTVREEKVVPGEGLDVLEIGAGATVNLDTDVSQSVYVYPGAILNIYSGSVDWFVIVSSNPGETNAVVTVFGTKFEVDWKCDGTFVSLDGADEFMPLSKTGSVLKVFYGNSDSDPIDLWFLSNGVPIKLQPPSSNVVAIDIKPGSNPNTINLKSKGVVPVAVLTTDGFDAGNIKPETVLFAGAEPVRWRLCDVDDDGDDDLLFHFKTQELVELDQNSTEATLTGETSDGNEITGSDDVRIVPQKKKK